jgi:hypothetical protein
MAQRTIKHLVERIHMINYLYFTIDKLDVGGTSHNKPLYIIIRYKDCTIGKVLVDNGSTLNVLLKHMLDEMPVDSTHMLPNTMMDKAYDGSPKKVVGIVEKEFFINPQVF